jgi:two-component system chemotaxis response regulator CheY
MEFFKKYDPDAFLRYLPKIKHKPDAWQAIEIRLSGKTSHNIFYIARKLQSYFSATEGLIFVCNSREILTFTMTGGNVDSLTSAVRCALPQFSCEVHTAKLTPDGLLTLQIELEKLDQDDAWLKQPEFLRSLRQQRQETVILVADDDKFMRTVINKALSPLGDIVELENAENIVDRYLEILPDIAFVDIHLPGKSGFDVLSEVLSFDENAYIVIMSSDSMKENILKAKNMGAKKFIAKPLTRERLMECCAACPTIQVKKA